MCTGLYDPNENENENPVVILVHIVKATRPLGADPRFVGAQADTPGRVAPASHLPCSRT